MSDASAWILSHSWAILPEMLETIIAVSRRDASMKELHEALATKSGEPLQNTRRVELREGVAILSLTGPIFPRANLFTYVSGGVSLDILAKEFTTALNSPDVGGIILAVDTPGGEVTAVDQFSKIVRAARSVKPITAYVLGHGASAGYWITSAAGTVAVDSTALLGSIGVVSGYVDQRKRDEKNGVQTIEIVSSVSPKKRPDPQTDEGRAQIQSTIDALADVFVQTVADNRGVSTQDVANRFGQGGLLVGKNAVEAGMADAVMSFEEAFDTMKSKIAQRKSLSLFERGF